MSVKAARAGGDAGRRGGRRFDLLAPEYEYLDPNPDLHALFQEYNVIFFDGKLAGCEVKWSPRMTLCAGLCSFQPRSGFCSIRLSEPLLKLRPRSDMVNTLLHEMIHAYVFVSSPVKDHDDHGPVFQSHMHRINQDAGTNITVFHTFHDEVDSYRQHWWQCDGPCRNTRPYFGLVKRAMNRPPGPTDRWWAEHQQKCGGVYTKIKSPPEFLRKEEAKKKREEKKRARASPSVKEFFTAPGDTAGASNKVEVVTKSKSDGKKKQKKPIETGSGMEAGKETKGVVKKPKSSDAGPSKPKPMVPTSSAPEAGKVAGILFPMVVATGANGEEELLLVGDINAVFGSTSAGGNNTWASTLPSSSQATVVDLTFSDSDSEEKPPPVPNPTPVNSSRHSTSTPKATSPEVIELD